MGTATGHDIHIDQNLTNVAINYRPMGMIADMIAPIVTVGKQSDYYPVWSQADILRVEDAKRAPGTEANKITRAVSSGAYYAENYALKTELTLEDRENMDAAYVSELRNGRARFLVGKMGLVWEARVANQLTSGSNIGSYGACASEWTDYTNSNPALDIWTAMDIVQDTTGYRPNRLLLSGDAWRYMRRNDTVIDLLHGDTGTGNPRIISRQQAAALFEVDQLLVGEAYYNSADEGQSQTLAKLWGDHALVYYAPSAPSIDEPSFMYSFRWSRPGLPNMTIERHPFDAKIKAEEIELGVYQDEVVTSDVLGYLFTNVTSST